MRTLPSCFGTTTIPAHQSVGSSTLEMTPSCSIRCSSLFAFGIILQLEVVLPWDLAKALKQIWVCDCVGLSLVSHCVDPGD